MNEEERIRAFLFPEEVEEEKEIFTPSEDENKAIEKIKEEIQTLINFEKHIEADREILHEEFEERYNPDMKISLILNVIIIFIILMFGWSIVVFVFEGNTLTWLICPLFVIFTIYDRFNPFSIKVPPNKEARKAVLLASAIAVLVASMYDVIKYFVQFI